MIGNQLFTPPFFDDKMELFQSRQPWIFVLDDAPYRIFHFPGGRHEIISQIQFHERGRKCVCQPASSESSVLLNKKVVSTRR